MRQFLEAGLPILNIVVGCISLFVYGCAGAVWVSDAEGRNLYGNVAYAKPAMICYFLACLALAVFLIVTGYDWLKGRAWAWAGSWGYAVLTPLIQGGIFFVQVALLGHSGSEPHVFHLIASSYAGLLLVCLPIVKPTPR